ncbi:cell wall protein [Streptomyces sp. DG2A-72]|uniref:cell wall protein n=1 Tax=Streptomyces sp. DG2A-72 TaxID=3051386 RepID=UPI00265BEC65|nr:cell wall protein [Streptomyces sp. DG2A-72]MDO0935699.1 cell wall protein [Streptomyces sp. DG2A-72]
MKLRRAMAVAAATAAISPFALLSAPAAFAEGSASPTPTETVTETVTETPSGTPSDTATATPSDTTLPTGTASASDAPTSSAPTGSATPSATESESGRPEPSESAEPSEAPDVPFCEELDEEFSDAKVSADIKGLPGKIVAGDGFHGFKLVVTNESGMDVEDVAFYAEVENYELDESKYLSPYVDLEFKNPESGSWERIGDSEWAGDLFFGIDTLKSKASQTVDLRVSIDAKAPAGDAYSFGSGVYLDNVDGQDCIAEGWAQYDFEVLKAGSANPDPGTATPGDNGSKGPGKKPQGSISDLPTGNLADTGANSALPAIGLVSGVAIVAGAGAVFAMRRRKAGANA